MFDKFTLRSVQTLMLLAGAVAFGPRAHADTCVHTTSTTGVALVTGCNACVTLVCGIDSYCCANGWDQVCVQEAQASCAVPPPVPPPASDVQGSSIPAGDPNCPTGGVQLIIDGQTYYACHASQCLPPQLVWQDGTSANLPASTPANPDPWVELARTHLTGNGYLVTGTVNLSFNDHSTSTIVGGEYVPPAPLVNSALCRLRHNSHLFAVRGVSAGVFAWNAERFATMSTNGNQVLTVQAPTQMYEEDASHGGFDVVFECRANSTGAGSATALNATLSAVAVSF